jgi:hypothetical protein
MIIRQKNILQNYLNTSNIYLYDFIFNNSNNIFYYKNELIFSIISKNHYMKYDKYEGYTRCKKNYKHNYYLEYFNNKNNILYKYRYQRYRSSSSKVRRLKRCKTYF